MVTLQGGPSFNQKYPFPSSPKGSPVLEIFGYTNIVAGMLLTIGIIIFLMRVPFTFTTSWISMLSLLIALGLTILGLFLITRSKKARRRGDKVTGLGLVLLIAMSIGIIAVNIGEAWIAFF